MAETPRRIDIEIAPDTHKLYRLTIGMQLAALAADHPAQLYFCPNQNTNDIWAAERLEKFAVDLRHPGMGTRRVLMDTALYAITAIAFIDRMEAETK